MTEGSLIRVFMLDDHEVVRAGLAQMIDVESDMVVVGSTGTASGALAAVAGASPDVAVLDVRLADGSGIDVCRDIRSKHPEVACLILTSFSDDRAIIEASLAGAAGFVLKQVRGNELVHAIRKVAGGANLLDAATVRLAHQRLRQAEGGVLEQLTEQERKIFDLIGEGYSNRQIGERMYLAEKTIKNYVSNILAKLGMDRRTEAAAFAARLEERERQRFT